MSMAKTKPLALPAPVNRNPFPPPDGDPNEPRDFFGYVAREVGSWFRDLEAAHGARVAAIESRLAQAEARVAELESDVAKSKRARNG